MGYLLGRRAGPPQIVTANLETEFKDAVSGSYTLRPEDLRNNWHGGWK